MNIAESAIDIIGNTPIVELSRLVEELNVKGKIFAKVEFFNPGFSKKDRIGLQMILDAEKQGLLKKGQTIIELTSGNTGTGLALVSAIKGYKFVAVMSKGNSIERAKMMEAFGARVELVDQAEGSTSGQVSGEDLELVEQRAQQLTEELDAFRADQFQLDGNWRAHYLNTAEEIIKEIETIDGFCDFVGSGGSFTGIAKRLKEYGDTKCFIVEPETAAVLSGKEISNPNHKIQGGGYSMLDLKFIDKQLVDGYLQVTDEMAKQMCHLLASKEGLFAGFSSGANVAAAIQLLKGEMRGKTVVVLLPDSGLKYLSTDLWNR